MGSGAKEAYEDDVRQAQELRLRVLAAIPDRQMLDLIDSIRSANETIRKDDPALSYKHWAQINRITIALEQLP